MEKDTPITVHQRNLQFLMNDYPGYIIFLALVSRVMNDQNA